MFVKATCTVCVTACTYVSAVESAGRRPGSHLVLPARFLGTGFILIAESDRRLLDEQHLGGFKHFVSPGRDREQPIELRPCEFAGGLLSGAGRS